jgi:hypothetical protein
MSWARKLVGNEVIGQGGDAKREGGKYKAGV